MIDNYGDSRLLAFEDKKSIAFLRIMFIFYLNYLSTLL